MILFSLAKGSLDENQLVGELVRLVTAAVRATQREELVSGLTRRSVTRFPPPLR
jgi:hypothetical protein